MPDETQDKPRRLFSIGDLASLKQTVQTRWVQVPEWRVDGEEVPSVCMWGTTSKEQQSTVSAARVGTEGNPDAYMARLKVAMVIDCARTGDGPDAKAIFNRVEHWGWLEKQPSSVMDRLYNTVQELDANQAISMGDIVSFFEMAQALKDCLTRIGLACGACTDCPANSRTTCPQQALLLRRQPTES